MSVPPASVYPFDARPLTEPVDPAAARAFTQELKATGRVPSGLGANVVGAIIGIVFAGFFVLMFLTVGGSIVASFISMGAQGGGFGLGIPIAFAVFGIIVLGLIVWVIVTVAVRTFRGDGGKRRFRLDRFARANGMSYVPSLPNPPLPGMIFSLGGDRLGTDLVRGERPRFVEFANYRYETGSGKERTTHRWGYVAVKLDVPLPHIVLDATSNNGLFGSNLPLSFGRDQRLSLEGDFDRHFALYAPSGYERDALYLFTPDIMARLIDNAAALDVEIVDDWLFLYAKRDFSTLDPAMWAWLFSVVGALLDKLAQWSRWRDDRLAGEAPAPVSPGAAASALPFTPPDRMLRPPPGVAAGGRRLKRGVPWGAIVVVGVFAVFWLLMQSGVFASLFGAILGR